MYWFSDGRQYGGLCDCEIIFNPHLNDNIMKQPVFLLIIAILMGLFMDSCTSANKEQLVPKSCKTDDSLYKVSYSNDIVPLFESRCYSCHGNGMNETSGGHNLQDTTELNSYIEDGRLRGNINQEPGFFPMPPPPDTKLSDCEINLVNTWIDQGSPKLN